MRRFEAASYQAFCDALNALRPGWTVKGNEVVGPEGAAVRLTERHESQSLGHYDVQFVFDTSQPEPLDMWDCVGGFGNTEAERATFAAQMWSLTTAGTVLELKYSRQGEFAEHYRGSDPDGFAGWHTIAGSILGFGSDANRKVLQQWYVDNPPLPAIERALGSRLGDGGAPFGLKILFGGDGVAEVRVNGQVDEPASAALAALPWPRLRPPAFARTYVILVHRDAE